MFPTSTSILGLVRNFPVILLGYIGKQISYICARQIDEQRKVSSENRLISASVQAVTLGETIVMQINTMRNTVLTLMNGAERMHAVVT